MYNITEKFYVKKETKIPYETFYQKQILKLLNY